MSFRFKKTCNVLKPFYGLSRVEIDFSKSLLAATVSAFNGMDVASFLRVLWKVIALKQKDEDKTILPVHICRFHSLRFLRDYVSVLIEQK